MIERSQVGYLLMNPPLTDPTAPYHSISYLVAATAAAGFTGYQCADVNIAMLNHMSQPLQVAALLDSADRTRARLEAAHTLSRGEQITYRSALKGVGLEPDSVTRAIAVLRHPPSFYRYDTYRQAAMVLKRWVDLFCVDSLPGAFDGFSLNPNGPINLGSVDDVTDAVVLDRLTAPFASYFDLPFADLLARRPWSLVGVSINYVSQLPFGIQMCRRIRELCPDVVLVVGGTEVSDDLKYLRNPRDIWRLFSECDAVVVGEGESALVHILEGVRQRSTEPVRWPGVLTRGDVGLSFPSVKYEDVAGLPTPRYDVWNWEEYWSPEPVVYYSPTRGCYWNKCTFCDYGLNTDGPTSPSRERSPDQVVADLRQTARIARTVYFAVDAMSPAYIRRLSQHLAEADLGIHWAAELRLERAFPKQHLGSVLHAAGCRAISFGYESGSQRVLDLIRKGVDLSRVPAILEELASAGIGAQMMGFIGFRTESQEEALATYELLRAHRHLWTLAGIGDFVLTKGSEVAKQPQEFGIRQLVTCAGDDIVRSLLWVDAAGHLNGPGSQRTEAIDQVAGDLRRFHDDRPFVGGIDSTHSLLYFARHGPCLVPTQNAHDGEDALVATQSYETPFGDVEDFVSVRDVEDVHVSFRLRGQAAGHRELTAWFGDAGERPHPSDTMGSIELEIYPSGDFLPADCREPSAAYAALKRLLVTGSGMV